MEKLQTADLKSRLFIDMPDARESSPILDQDVIDTGIMLKALRRTSPYFDNDPVGVLPRVISSAKVAKFVQFSPAAYSEQELGQNLTRMDINLYIDRLQEGFQFPEEIRHLVEDVFAYRGGFSQFGERAVEIAARFVFTDLKDRYGVFVTRANDLYQRRNLE